MVAGGSDTRKQKESSITSTTSTSFSSQLIRVETLKMTSVINISSIRIEKHLKSNHLNINEFSDAPKLLKKSLDIVRDQELFSCQKFKTDLQSPLDYRDPRLSRLETFRLEICFPNFYQSFPC